MSFLETRFMKRRVLKKLTHTEILLGRLYPKLVELRDSEFHGNLGELDIKFRGFRITWDNSLPNGHRPPETTWPQLDTE